VPHRQLEIAATGRPRSVARVHSPSRGDHTPGRHRSPGARRRGGGSGGGSGRCAGGRARAGPRRGRNAGARPRGRPHRAATAGGTAPAAAPRRPHRRPPTDRGHRRRARRAARARVRVRAPILRMASSPASNSPAPGLRPDNLRLTADLLLDDGFTAHRPVHLPRPDRRIAPAVRDLLRFRSVAGGRWWRRSRGFDYALLNDTRVIDVRTVLDWLTQVVPTTHQSRTSNLRRRAGAPMTTSFPNGSSSRTGGDATPKPAARPDSGGSLHRWTLCFGYQPWSAVCWLMQCAALGGVRFATHPPQPLSTTARIRSSIPGSAPPTPAPDREPRTGRLPAFGRRIAMDRQCRGRGGLDPRHDRCGGRCTNTQESGRTTQKPPERGESARRAVTVAPDPFPRPSVPVVGVRVR
jgi:hypothetical protein